MSITNIVPTVGKFGTPIIINGADFGNIGYAWIGTSEVLVQSYSDTRIVGTVGWGLSRGAHDVIVFNAAPLALSSSILDSGFTAAPATGTTARETLRKAVKYRIEQITTANGYNNNVFRAYDPPREYTAMNQLPAVNLIWGREDRDDIHKSANNPLLDLSIDVEIVGYFNERNDPYAKIDSFISDVQRMFGINFYIPGEDNGRTCFNCIYQGAEPFGIEANKPFFGVSIELRIWYRTRLADPTTMN